MAKVTYRNFKIIMYLIGIYLILDGFLSVFMHHDSWVVEQYLRGLRSGLGIAIILFTYMRHKK